jgi:hypothetical protein
MCEHFLGFVEIRFIEASLIHGICHNPTLKECEDDTHTLEMGTWESFGTPKNVEFDCRGQNTSP